ncbi:MAG TPA: hypothetical protein VEA59_07110 [Patescibacteria group bacterium]|nr:hypothetical protein [Patescibacteria group bacterium]
MNQDILKFISAKKSRGESDETIRQALVHAGWEPSVIDAALSNAASEPTAPQNPLATGFQPVFENLKSSFKIYKDIFWRMLGVAYAPLVVLVPLGLLMALTLFLTSFGEPAQTRQTSAGEIIIFVLLGIAIFSAIILTVLSEFGAIILLLKNKSFAPTVWSVWKQALQKAHIFFGAFVLFVLITLGSSILLIIPAIIVCHYLQWIFYNIYEDNLGPVKALKASWDLTKNYWWETFGRAAFIGIVAFAVALLQLIPGIGVLISLLWFPVPIIYTYITFRQLKTIKTQNLPKTKISNGALASNIIAGVFGLMLVSALVYFITAAASNPEKFWKGFKEGLMGDVQKYEEMHNPDFYKTYNNDMFREEGTEFDSMIKEQ